MASYKDLLDEYNYLDRDFSNVVKTPSRLDLYSKNLGAVQLFDKAREQGLGDISYNDALAQGYLTEELGRSKRSHWLDYVDAETTAKKFLESKGTYADIFPTVGLLPTAKKAGYAGEDLGEAASHIRSLADAKSQARNAGLDVSNINTWEELTALVQSSEKNSREFSSANRSPDSTELAGGSTKTDDDSSMPASGITAGMRLKMKEQGMSEEQIAQAEAQAAAQGAPLKTGAPVSTYTGNSIVDFLKSTGQDSSFSARKILAEQAGIKNYSGTAQQNTQLLSMMRQRGGGGTVADPNPSVTAGMMKGGGGAPTGGGTGTPASEGGSAIGTDAEKIAKSLFAAYGITPPSKEQSAQSSFTEVYKQVYKDLGLQDIKDMFEEVSKEFSDLQEEKNDKASSINANPWLSEGERVNQLRNLDRKYEGKEQILMDKIKLLETTYDNGRQDAQYVTGQMMDEIQRTTDLNNDIITKAIDIAEAQAKAEKTLSEGIDKDQRTTINNLIQTYPDAGILTTDTLEVAAAKASQSALYEKKTLVKATGSGTKPPVKFTTTQLNTGATKAGVGIEDFKKLDDDVKNFFINTSATNIKAMTDQIKLAKDDPQQSPETIELIDSSNLAQPVKDYFKSLVPAYTPKKKTKVGKFLQDLF